MTDLSIDSLYQAFTETLPQGLAVAATELPMRLGLAPSRDVPWSQVFRSDVTLKAPPLFFAGADVIPPALLREATLAHLLAVVEAFGIDRIEDGQVEPSTELRTLLGLLRLARDQTLTRMTRGILAPDEVNRRLRKADRATIQAIRAEREILHGARTASFDDYKELSLRKQNSGLIASMMLAEVLGWNERRLRTLKRSLEATFLGLQFEDDVADWEDDWREGGAWAFCLARGLHYLRRPSERPTQPRLVQTMILSSGVLERMLRMAYRHFRFVRRHAQAAKANELAQWAGERERQACEYARGEATYAGYSTRARKLAAWAAEVLA